MSYLGPFFTAENVTLLVAILQEIFYHCNSLEPLPHFPICDSWQFQYGTYNFSFNSSEVKGGKQL